MDLRALLLLFVTANLLLMQAECGRGRKKKRKRTRLEKVNYDIDLRLKRSICCGNLSLKMAYRSNNRLINHCPIA